MVVQMYACLPKSPSVLSGACCQTNWQRIAPLLKKRPSPANLESLFWDRWTNDMTYKRQLHMLGHIFNRSLACITLGEMWLSVHTEKLCFLRASQHLLKAQSCAWLRVSTTSDPWIRRHHRPVFPITNMFPRTVRIHHQTWWCLM